MIGRADDGYQRCTEKHLDYSLRAVTCCWSVLQLSKNADTLTHCVYPTKRVAVGDGVPFASPDGYTPALMSVENIVCARDSRKILIEICEEHATRRPLSHGGHGGWLRWYRRPAVPPAVVDTFSQPLACAPIIPPLRILLQQQTNTETSQVRWYTHLEPSLDILDTLSLSLRSSMNAEFDDDDLRLDSGAGSQIAEGVSRRWPRPRWLPGSDDEAEQGDMTDPGRPTSQEGSEDDGDEIMASASPSRSADPGLSEEERAIIHGAIVRCYREVWTEFYEWEPYDSLQTLRSLSTVTVPAGPHYSLDDGDWSLYAVGDAQATDTGPEDRLTVDTESKFEVCEWDSEGTLYERTVPVSVLHSSSQVIPHPPYEACAPTYASIDPNLYSGQPECRFIKYAGQPGFNERDYLRKFHSISWQQPWRDSDRK